MKYFSEKIRCTGTNHSVHRNNIFLFLNDIDPIPSCPARIRLPASRCKACAVGERLNFNIACRNCCSVYQSSTLSLPRQYPEGNSPVHCPHPLRTLTQSNIRFWRPYPPNQTLIDPLSGRKWNLEMRISSVFVKSADIFWTIFSLRLLNPPSQSEI